MKKASFLFKIILLSFLSCSTNKDSNDPIEEIPTPETNSFYYGADLSYVNEMDRLRSSL